MGKLAINGNICYNNFDKMAIYVNTESFIGNAEASKALQVRAEVLP